MRPKALPTEVGLGQLVGLDHRAHGTVEHEDALGEQPFERRQPTGAGGVGRTWQGHQMGSNDDARGQNGSGRAF